jgi:hypothetical protein
LRFGEIVSGTKLARLDRTPQSEDDDQTGIIVSGALISFLTKADQSRSLGVDIEVA